LRVPSNQARRRATIAPTLLDKSITANHPPERPRSRRCQDRRDCASRGTERRGRRDPGKGRAARTTLRASSRRLNPAQALHAKEDRQVASEISAGNGTFLDIPRLRTHRTRHPSAPPALTSTAPGGGLARSHGDSFVPVAGPARKAALGAQTGMSRPKDFRLRRDMTRHAHAWQTRKTRHARAGMRHTQESNLPSPSSVARWPPTARLQGWRGAGGEENEGPCACIGGDPSRSTDAARKQRMTTGHRKPLTGPVAGAAS
jgi:hypothetical protein